MKYYNPDEAAKILKIKPSKIYELIYQHKIIPLKLGANYRISQKQLRNYYRTKYKSKISN